MSVPKRRRVARNLSLQADHDLAISFLMEEAGEEARSVVVQELIEREMYSRFGRNWREQLRERISIGTIGERELAAAS